MGVDRVSWSYAVPACTHQRQTAPGMHSKEVFIRKYSHSLNDVGAVIPSLINHQHLSPPMQHHADMAFLEIYSPLRWRGFLHASPPPSPIHVIHQSSALMHLVGSFPSGSFPTVLEILNLDLNLVSPSSVTSFKLTYFISISRVVCTLVPKKQKYCKASIINELC